MCWLCFCPRIQTDELPTPGTLQWDEGVWQSLPMFLRLPLRNDTYLFYYKSYSKARQKSMLTTIENLLTRKGIPDSEYFSFFWK
jgi:hypothetical protein